MRGVTGESDQAEPTEEISTHTPHARRDDICCAFAFRQTAFQLTRLMRGVTKDKNPHVHKFRKFQLTRLMRGVTAGMKYGNRILISTHTPHARRDLSSDFSTFSPVLFQLTRLMRGVTSTSRTWKGDEIFQLTRLMRGVTRH